MPHGLLVGYFVTAVATLRNDDGGRAFFLLGRLVSDRLASWLVDGLILDVAFGSEFMSRT